MKNLFWIGHYFSNSQTDKCIFKYLLRILTQRIKGNVFWMQFKESSNSKETIKWSRLASKFSRQWPSVRSSKIRRRSSVWGHLLSLGGGATDAEEIVSLAVTSIANTAGTLLYKWMFPKGTCTITSSQDCQNFQVQSGSTERRPTSKVLHTSVRWIYSSPWWHALWILQVK